MDDNALRGEYLPKRLLSPIDPAAFGKSSVEELEADYVPGTLDGAKDAEGKLYGVPSEFNGTAFAINTKHFKDAGLDPAKPPKTWQEVIAAGKKLNAAGHKQAFNFLYLHSGWYNQWFQTLTNQTGGSILSPDGKTAQLTRRAAWRRCKLWVELARTQRHRRPEDLLAGRDRAVPGPGQRHAVDGDRLPVVDGPDQGAPTRTPTRIWPSCRCPRPTAIEPAGQPGVRLLLGGQQREQAARPRRGSSSPTWPAPGSGG